MVDNIPTNHFAPGVTAVSVSLEIYSIPELQTHGSGQKKSTSNGSHSAES